MLISELSFPHLQAEREARLTRELERRRVALERLDEQAPRARSRRRTRQSREAREVRQPRVEPSVALPPAASSERMPQADAETRGAELTSTR